MKQTFLLLAIMLPMFSSCSTVNPDKSDAKKSRNVDSAKSCYDDQNHYQAGKSFPSSDGCNTCSCQEDGSVACTEMACSDKTSCELVQEESSKFILKSVHNNPDSKSCKTDSDCVLKDVSIGPSCGNVLALAKSIFTKDFDKRFEDLQQKTFASCKDVEYDYSCPAVEPYTRVSCESNVCQGGYNQE